MITFTQLTDSVQEDLNAVLDAHPLIINGEMLRFFIVPDTGSKKVPERSDNVVTRYIMGQSTLISSNNETTSTGKRNATYNIGIRFLVEKPQEEYEEEEDDTITMSYLKDAVRSVLDSYFITDKVGSFVDDGGISYTYGANFTVMSTGTREMLPGAGDSLSFYVSGRYFILQDGVNSRSLSLRIDGKEIDCLLKGFCRMSDSEPSTPSDADVSGSAASIANGSTFSINFDMPVCIGDRASPFDNYLRGKESPNTAHVVEVIYPRYIGEDGEAKTETDTYNMIFAQVTMNAQTSQNMSMSVQMQLADMTVCEILSED